MLLLHGSGMSSIAWRQNIGTLSKYFSLYVPDLPDFENSLKTHPFAHSLDQYAEIVYGFMSALDIDRAHLVGLSLGGAIADLLALRHPEKVHRLVLISALGLRGETNIDSQKLQELERESLMKRPVLIITGESDPSIRCDAVCYIVARNPLARWVIIPDGRHLLQEECAEAVNRHIISYCIETPVNTFCG